MRKPKHLLALVSLAAVVTSCGSTSSSTFSPALPKSVQREIVKAFPRIAYVPTERPAFPYGSHFTKFFSNAPHTFGLSFSGPGGPDAIGFTVGQVQRCGGHSMHTFALNGVLIRWSTNGVDQEAWRCVKRGDVTVSIGAGRSVSGDISLKTPQERIDAMVLVRMVAHIKYIG